MNNMNELKKTTIEITAEEGRIYTLCLKEPTFDTYTKALNILNNSSGGIINFVQAGDVILLDCIINEESDMVILQRSDLRATAAQAATGILNIWSADVKKS